VTRLCVADVARLPFGTWAVGIPANPAMSLAVHPILKHFFSTRYLPFAMQSFLEHYRSQFPLLWMQKGRFEATKQRSLRASSLQFKIKYVYCIRTCENVSTEEVFESQISDHSTIAQDGNQK
jgi:hypothetical protein